MDTNGKRGFFLLLQLLAYNFVFRPLRGAPFQLALLRLLALPSGSRLGSLSFPLCLLSFCHFKWMIRRIRTVHVQKQVGDESVCVALFASLMGRCFRDFRFWTCFFAMSSGLDLRSSKSAWHRSVLRDQYYLAGFSWVFRLLCEKAAFQACFADFLRVFHQSWEVWSHVGLSTCSITKFPSHLINLRILQSICLKQITYEIQIKDKHFTN